jgi:hypothetical protein
MSARTSIRRSAEGLPLAEIIEPSRTLADKIGRGGSMDPAAIDRAAANVTAMTGDYLAALDKDVQALEAQLAALTAAETADAVAAQVAAMRALLHEMRGMGGTFGFPLISRFADRLHGILSEPGRIDGARLATVTVYVRTLRAVAAHRVTGDGGAIANELLGELTRLSAV